MKLITSILFAALMTLTGLSASVQAEDQHATFEAVATDQASIVLDETPMLDPECAQQAEYKAFDGELLLAQGCCRVCRTGKACGNSCISRSYTCHQGAGCACNG